MRSNRFAQLPLWLVLVGAAAAAISLQPRLAQRFLQLRVTSDVYALPSPDQTVVASLGYRSALADLILAHVLVSSGIHVQEKRRFEFVGRYLDTINALDPSFRAPYRFADTLLTIQSVPPRKEDYRKARQILERGLKHRPYDAELALMAGQYIAYVAAPHLEESERDEWQRAGARILARACELVDNNERIPRQCLSAASLLHRQGNQEALVQFLQRVLVVNDDPDIRRKALGYLNTVAGKLEAEQARERAERIQRVRELDLPFISTNLALVVGPPFDPAACAGLERSDAKECATSWQDWSTLPGDTTEGTRQR